MRLRLRLLAATAPIWAPVWALAPAAAVDVDDTREDPIATSTIDGGGAGEINILQSGRVEVDGVGVDAVTMDSNHAVTNAGAIVVEDSDDATAILRVDGFSSSIINNGLINVTETYTGTDTDEDGDLDGAFASGSGRTGILIEGPSLFTGDVQNNAGASIAVEGDDSAGVRAEADIDGSVRNRGSISVIGDNAVGLDLEGVTGDLSLGGTVAATGENATAVHVAGDIGGAIDIYGSFFATGFRYTNRSNYVDPDSGLDDSTLDTDDLLTGGPAVAVNGSVADGLLVNGKIGDFDDDEEGDPKVEDWDYDPNRTPGSIQAYGSAPGLLVQAAGADLTLGTVVETVRDTTDDDEDEDVEETLATFNYGYGLMNRGTISGNGLNMGFDAVALMLAGSDDTLWDVIVDGGIMNSGSITATAYEANAVAIHIKSGAMADRFHNVFGNVEGFVNTETDNIARAILVDAGAELNEIMNSGNLVATSRGDDGDAIVVEDLSGTLSSFTNYGVLLARYVPDGDDDDDDGDAFDTDERTGELIALDASSHLAGENVAFLQESLTPTEDRNGDGEIDENDVPVPFTSGALRFGAGDDSVTVLDGQMFSDIRFGDGADAFLLDNGATYRGDINDSDGLLTLDVLNGAFILTAIETLDLTSGSLGDDAQYIFRVDVDGGDSATLNASGIFSIAAGATIAPELEGLLEDEVEVALITAGDLQVAGDIADNLQADTPFLYNTTLALADGDPNTAVLQMSRKTAVELGMNANQGAAYEPAILALLQDSELGQAVANLTTKEAFFLAYDQLLPEHAAAGLQFTIANVDGAVGAVANRLDVIRAGRAANGGAWVQEFTAYTDRGQATMTPGYRGDSLGVAVGVDRPLGPFYAAGINLVGAASKFEEHTGFDQPLNVVTGQIGAYAASEFGPLLIDFYGGVGADFYESDREVRIGALVRNAKAEWTGYHGSASARAGFEFDAGPLVVAPSVSLDYLTLQESGFEETGGGDGVNLVVDDRTSESVSASAILSIGARFNRRGRTWWSPRLRVGYREELAGDATVTMARFASTPDFFELNADELPDGAGVFGFTFAAGSDYSSFSFDYDADIRDGFERHTARVAFRFLF